jgi:hypothetical protein
MANASDLLRANRMLPYRATIHRIAPPAALPGADDPVWAQTQTLLIDQFRPEGSSHRPQTSLQLAHDDQSVFGLFRVCDQYVRCVHRNYGDPVYRDSCVEFFIQPRAERGYFNFEFNCGGAFLCNYITDETRVPDGFKEYLRLTAEDVAAVRIVSSLPPVIEPERTQPVTWWLAFAIPVRVVEPFVGPVGALAGQVWRGNAYKCGSGTSHPHWAAWAPVDELNFHRPRCFGEWVFA